MNKTLKKIVRGLLAKGVFKKLPDKQYLKLRFWASMDKYLNLKNPQTFNEKLQWLKLYDRKPEYTKMVDKYEVKKYVADIIGEEYIIPTLGVWDKFEDIDFDKLPNKFVLKCTHDSGGLVICKDKSQFDIEKAKEKINKSLKKNYYYWGREWPYKNVKPKIIAEKYMEDSKTSELRDYKFYNFNGEVKILYVFSERSFTTENKMNFYDEEFNKLPIRQYYPNSNKEIEKPNRFDEMIKLSERLSEKKPFVRIDFYEVDGKIYFGESTFYAWSGMVPFEPEEWDYTLGSWINLDI